MIIMRDQMWVPPMDFFYAGSPDVYKFYTYNNGIDIHYGTSMYYAIAAVGGNEMGPRSETEIFCIFVGLVLLIFINSIFFGEVINLV
jgi:hypothetical protein